MGIMHFIERALSEYNKSVYSDRLLIDASSKKVFPL
jgi:hypothetical protein